MPDDATDGPEHVSLIDDDGHERTFTLHDAFDLEGATYYLVEGADDPDEVMLLRESGEGLETVDQEEFERVMTALEHDEVD